MSNRMNCVVLKAYAAMRRKHRFPTTLSYSPLHDHKRLPGRFHAKLTGAADSDLG